MFSFLHFSNATWLCSSVHAHHVHLAGASVTSKRKERHCTMVNSSFAHVLSCLQMLLLSTKKHRLAENEIRHFAIYCAVIATQLGLPQSCFRSCRNAPEIRQLPVRTGKRQPGVCLGNDERNAHCLGVIRTLFLLLQTTTQ